MATDALWNPRTISAEEGPESLDASLAALPAGPAVFLIVAVEGRPYLGKTTMLPRRLGRLLGPRPAPSRMLNLRSVATRVEYRPTASGLETSLVLYAAARQHYPETYAELIRLRMPPYVKIVLSNAFPRSQMTTRLSDSHGFYYGPFRARRGGAVRKPVLGPVSDAPMPGEPETLREPSRLHVWRDESVLAALPDGGERGCTRNWRSCGRFSNSATNWPATSTSSSAWSCGSCSGGAGRRRGALR